MATTLPRVTIDAPNFSAGPVFIVKPAGYTFEIHSANGDVIGKNNAVEKADKDCFLDDADRVGGTGNGVKTSDGPFLVVYTNVGFPEEAPIHDPAPEGFN